MPVTKEINQKVLDALTIGLEEFSSKEVRVGYFKESKYPDGTPVAAVAAAHEYGVPKNNLPPRPFMRQTIIREQDKWKETADRANKAFSEGKISADNALNQVGLMAQADVKQSIIKITQPPWSPATKAQREAAKPKSIGKLLIDTGILLASANYKLVDRESIDDDTGQ